MNPGCDLTYLLWAANLRGRWRCGLAIFSEVPHILRQVPCEFHWDWPKHSWGYPWGVCLKGGWCDLAHLLWAALLPVRGWYPPAILTAHLPTPLPHLHWVWWRSQHFDFFSGSHPGAGMVASPSTTLAILGRPYLLSPLSEGPAVFCPEVGNMSPSPPQEGGALPPICFFEGNCARDRGEGAEQQPPQCHPCNPGEAVTPTPLISGIWVLPFWAPCPLPLARDTGGEVPNFDPSDGPLFKPPELLSWGCYWLGATWTI